MYNIVANITALVTLAGLILGFMNSIDWGARIKKLSEIRAYFDKDSDEYQSISLEMRKIVIERKNRSKFIDLNPLLAIIQDPNIGYFKKGKCFLCLGVIVLLLGIALILSYFVIYSFYHLILQSSWQTGLFVFFLTVVVCNFAIGLAMLLATVVNDKLIPKIISAIAHKKQDGEQKN